MIRSHAVQRALQDAVGRVRSYRHSSAAPCFVGLRGSRCLSYLRAQRDGRWWPASAPPLHRSAHANRDFSFGAARKWVGFWVESIAAWWTSREPGGSTFSEMHPEAGFAVRVSGPRASAGARVPRSPQNLRGGSGSRQSWSGSLCRRSSVAVRGDAHDRQRPRRRTCRGSVRS